MLTYHNRMGISYTVLGWLIFISACRTDASMSDPIESHIHRSHTTNQGQKVLILDALFTQDTLHALQTLILYNSPWQIHNDQEFPSLVKQTPQRKGEDDLESSDPECSAEVFPWSVQIPGAIFTKFNIWTRLKECLKYATGVDDYIPYEITAAMLQRGMSMNATCGVGQQDNRQEHIIRLFLTSDWLQNFYHYGDLTLFRNDDEGDMDDIGDGISNKVLLNVEPKYGRIAIWDTSIPYLSHSPVPTGDVEKSLFLTIRCTRDREKVKESQKQIEAELIKMESSQFFRFPKFKSLPIKQNWSKKITEQFQDKRGRSIAVFDALFTSEDIDNLKMYVSHQGPHFIWRVSDVSAENTSGNAKWSKTFEPEDFVHSQWWKAIAEIANYVSRSKWYPYEVTFNADLNTDQIQIQQDCEDWENDQTFVMYLNANEMSDMCGDTTFFDRVPETKDDIILQDTEVPEHTPIGVVKPQYGRAVIFKGAIPYSTTPSNSAHEEGIMPLSFIVKMAATRKQAIAKRIRKILNDFPGDLTETEENLLQELTTRKNHPLKKTEKLLMEELNKLVVKMDDTADASANKARRTLLAK